MTLELATSEPRLRSIFLGGAGTGQRGIGRREVTEAIADALEAEDPTAIIDPSAKAFRSFADATGQDRLALAAIQRSGQRLDRGAVSTIKLPTLVVNGERDTLVGDPASLAALIEGARSLLVPGDHISAVVKPEFREALVGWALAGSEAA